MLGDMRGCRNQGARLSTKNNNGNTNDNPQGNDTARIFAYPILSNGIVNTMLISTIDNTNNRYIALYIAVYSHNSDSLSRRFQRRALTLRHALEYRSISRARMPRYRARPASLARSRRYRRSVNPQFLMRVFSGQGYPCAPRMARDSITDLGCRASALRRHRS